MRFTRYEGYKRAILGAVFCLGGLGLGLGVATEWEDWGDKATAAAVGVWSGMTALGYLWGSLLH